MAPRDKDIIWRDRVGQGGPSAPNEPSDPRRSSDSGQPSTAGTISLDRIRRLCDAIAEFPAEVRERGKYYAKIGRVAFYDCVGDVIFGVVRGSQEYDTEWHQDSGAWNSECTCPVGPDCKHAYALACAFVTDHLPEQLRHESWVMRLLPFDPGLDRAIESDPSFARLQAVRTREESAFDRLRSVPDGWSRLRALSDLVGNRLRQDVFDAPFPQIVAIDDADLRCWHLAQVIQTLAQGWVPPLLNPFLNRPDLEQRHRERLEAVLLEHVEDWVSRPRPLPTRSLRLQLSLTEDVARTAAIRLEVRVSSKRMRDEPRNLFQLRQLIGEAQRGGVLRAEERELLSLVLDPSTSLATVGSFTSFELPHPALLRLLHRIATPEFPSELASWSTQAPAHLLSRAGIEPGSPVRLSTAPLSLEPSLIDAGGKPRVVLEYVAPDGRTFGPNERVILRGRELSNGRSEPMLVLAQGEFWTTRGDVPQSVANLFDYAGGFDLARKEARSLIEPLARTSPRFQRAMTPYTRVHQVRLAACLDLRSDDWLQIRAFAPAAADWRPGEPLQPGTPTYEWKPDGRWARSTISEESSDGASVVPIDDPPAAVTQSTQASPAAPPASGTPEQQPLIEMPDPSRTVLLSEWLSSTGAVGGLTRRPGGHAPEHEDRDVGAWLRLSRQGIERFAQAWDARPKEVEWYGNAAARRLLAPANRIAPRVNVKKSGIDWFTVSAEWTSEGFALSEADLAKLRSSESRFVKLPSGWVRKDQATALDAAAEVLAELGIEPGVEEEVSVWQLARAKPEALEAIEPFASTAESLAVVRELRERIAAFAGVPRVPVPRAIRAKLRPYQRDGLDFLAHTASLGLGAVLADDMGLGKTVQALAWLARLRAEDPEGGPSLVVCPASVIHNWEREPAKFAPSLRVLALTAGEERHALKREISSQDLVVTNYALLRRDLEELQAVEWRAVILDEAQNIKNPDAVAAQAARSLRAKHRLALTGTPLENRALDLWSIVTFLNPGYLGSRREFSGRFDRLDAPPHAHRLLAAKLRPILLRRLKSQVAPELPPRIEERQDCELTPGQRQLYLAELEKGRQILALLATKGPAEVAKLKISILAVLTRMRQICCHPELVGGKAAIGSGKFEAFFELLEPLLAEEHKVLVFSQFVECLQLIAKDMRQRGIMPHLLTGQSRKRAELIAAFESDPKPSPFLISLKAGGTGLNLTAASYVVLFDPWWNPAVEAQAIDRTHRIGQDRTVIAYRMVTRGTIEERIQELQERKANLVKGVLGEDGFAKALTREDLDYLLAEV